MKNLIITLTLLLGVMSYGQTASANVYAWDEGVYSTRFTGQDDCLGYDRFYSLILD